MHLTETIHKVVEIGLHNSVPDHKKRHVRFLNVTLLVSLFTVFFFICLNLFYYKLYKLGIAEIGLLVFIFYIFYLNYLGKFKLARSLFFIAVHLFIIAVSMYLNVGRMTEYLHFVVILLLMYFYIESRSFIILYLVNLCLFYLPQIVYHPYPDDIYSWPNPLVFFISIFVIVKTFNQEHQDYEKTLDERNKQLQELNKQKDELVRLAAHDLRSPLSRIEGLISLLKMTSSNLTDEQKQLLDKVSKVSKDQNEMIRKILDLSAVNVKLEGLKTYKVNVVEILDAAVGEFYLLSQKKNIKLITHYSTPGAYIMGHRESLKNIFENLLSNALKFSPYNTTVSVITRCTDNKVTVEISDQGPGFTQEDKKNMFQQFQKLSAQPTANESSSGLGLSITKKYVEALKGKISCVSNYGEGATFLIEFDRLHQADLAF